MRAKLTLEQARKILDTPPVVIDQMAMKDRNTLLLWRKVRYEYSGIEVEQTRRIVLPSDTGWTV
jgi:hypothetical protein